MTPNDILRTKLRSLVDERIPPGGTDADTRFLDSELDDVLIEAKTINQAAAEVWTLKATRAMSERDGLQESSAGDERFKFVDLETYKDHCLEMARFYKSKDSKGSRLFAVDPPAVL